MATLPNRTPFSPFGCEEAHRRKQVNISLAARQLSKPGEARGHERLATHHQLQLLTVNQSLLIRSRLCLEY